MFSFSVVFQLVTRLGAISDAFGVELVTPFEESFSCQWLVCWPVILTFPRLCMQFGMFSEATMPEDLFWRNLHLNALVNAL
jgi:hypothetical protein